MQRSAFESSQNNARITSSSKLVVDETYDLRGLDMVTPDQIKPVGETPFAENFRMYARDEDDTRVAIRTRKGSSRITTADAETLSTQNVATSTGDLEFSPTRIIAQPFNAGSTNALTRLDFEVKKNLGATGHIMIELRADNGGVPGTMIGASSILSSAVTDTYQYLPAYFMDAPNLVNGTQYWALLYVQDNGSNTYHVRQTADVGALDLESTDAQITWSSLGVSFRFKSYMAENDGVKGFARYYPSNGNKRTLMAAGGNLFSAEDNGTVTNIDSTLNAGSEFVRFCFLNDKAIYVNGINAMKKWNGTTVSTITGAPSGASLVKVHQGRVFALTEKVLFRFSELYDEETWPSVNFFYVPEPKSNDPVTGARTFQDNFVIFTHETKHIIYGSDISTFTRKEAVGTKGAVSDEAIAVDRNNIYFMADDGQIYAYNGSTDTLISEKMEPEFAAITDRKQVRLHLYRNQLRVYYPGPTSSTNDRMAIFDITSAQWFKDTGRQVIGSLEWNQDDANDLIEFSSRTAWMFRGEQGYSDLGKPIDFKYWTNYKTYGSGTSKKRVKRFRPVIRTVDADYTLSIGKDMDFADNPDMRAYVVTGGGAKFGNFLWGDGTTWGKKKMISKKSAMSGRGEHIQYRFERYGVETPVELYGYVAQVKVGRPK